MLTAALTMLGLAKRWLNAREGLLAFGLLAIPYVSRGYDNSLQSGARFASVVMPVYLVLGRLLYTMLPPLAYLFVGLAAFWLGMYSALFAAGYRLY